FILLFSMHAGAVDFAPWPHTDYGCSVRLGGGDLSAPGQAVRIDRADDSQIYERHHNPPPLDGNHVVINMDGRTGYNHFNLDNARDYLILMPDGFYGTVHLNG